MPSDTNGQREMLNRKGSAALETLSGLFGRAGIQINGGSPWDIQIHDERTAARVLAQGSMGLGESYMDGWWDCDVARWLL